MANRAFIAQEMIRMIDATISAIATELGLKTSTVGAFGKYNGVLFSVVVDSLGQYCLYFYVGERQKSDGKEISKQVSSLKLKGLKSSRYNHLSHCLEVHFNFGFVKADSVKSRLLDIIQKTSRLCPKAPEGDFELVGFHPVLLSEREHLVAKGERWFWSSSKRFALSLGLLSILNLVSFLLISQFLEMFGRYQNNFIHLLIIITMFSFFFRRKPNAVNPWIESAQLLAITIFAILTSFLVMTMASIPKEFVRSLALLELSLHRNSQLFAGLLIAPIAIFIVQVIQIFSVARPKDGQRTVAEVLAAQDIIQKNARRGKIFVITGLLLMFACLPLLITADKTANMVDSSRLVGFIVCFHLVLALSYYRLVYSSVEMKEACRAKYGGTTWAMIFFACILFPFFFTLSATIVFIFANFKLDNSEPQKMQAVVSRHRLQSAPLAYCLQTQDAADGHILSFSMCSREHGYIEGGEPVSYLYKPGIFKTGITYGQSIDRPKTWATLIEQKPNFSLIRFTDFEAVWRGSDKEKFINQSLITEWQGNCLNGQGVFCRFLAYRAELQKDPPTSFVFYQKGCEAGDYSACFGWRLGDSKNGRAIGLHEQLSQRACLDKDDYSACLQYWWNWKDDKSSIRRGDLKRVLDKLCSQANRGACDSLVWEQFRK